MSWSTATLTKASSLAKLEDEINDLTDTNWNDKIAVAKEMISDRLEVMLKDNGLDDYITYSDGDDIKDLVSNPTMFNLSSDFLTLHLIYEDLARGKETGGYAYKRDKYEKKYKEQLEIDLQRVDYDYDQDSNTDEYQQSLQDFGRVVR